MNLNDLLFMSIKDVEKMSISEKKKYYEVLRNYCFSLGKRKQKITLVQKFLSLVAPKIRNYDFEIRGIDNLSDDGSLIMVNHSNSHDAFTMFEAMSSVNKPAIIYAANEGVSPFLTKVFEAANFTLLNRRDKNSVVNATYDFTNKLLNGNNCFMYGEGTWNMHPIKPMQNLWVGGAKIAAISNKPIIPCIFEYIEVPDIKDKEGDIYRKCIVTFGKPINIDPCYNLFEQTKKIQCEMENMRKDLWNEFGVKRDSIRNINPEVYINHTGLKVYGGAGEFDYDREKNSLLLLNGERPELMYTLDDNKLVPGELTKDVFQRTLRKQ